MKQRPSATLLALLAAALMVSVAVAARAGPEPARIADDSAADAAAALAAAAARLGAAVLLGADQCEPLAQDACAKTEGCVWCRCAAVPSACFTAEQAKHLPPAVFQCDWPSAP
ncbi:hypothetical protein Rsub_04639 [Raphidocelis subcapitata]|uniref:Uncharacterized protein n=1 Tax=Raphidocelis subcapitata TaxID=307507 RepID=A0A2V0P4A3_9CHLO|nr:hypothetical protein Rsub_04639 [Raphidocelis subcapitata]|eukprot:GBF91915.1 hypothetical protein Rsub_04639 [Raphidocelis subcapitata]